MGSSNQCYIDRSTFESIKNIQLLFENENMNPNPIYLEGKQNGHSMNYYETGDKKGKVDAIVDNVQIVNSMTTRGSSKVKTEISNVQMKNMKCVISMAAVGSSKAKTEVSNIEMKIMKNGITSDLNNVNIVNCKESRSWIDNERYNEWLKY